MRTMSINTNNNIETCTRIRNIAPVTMSPVIVENTFFKFNERNIIKK